MRWFFSSLAGWMAVAITMVCLPLSAATFTVTVPATNTLTSNKLPRASSGTQLGGDSAAFHVSSTVLGLPTFTEGYETLTPGANVTLNWLTGRSKSITLAQSTTFAFSNVPSATTNIQRMVVRVVGDGAFTVAFTGALWQTTQVATPPASVITIYLFEAQNSNVYGYTFTGGSETFNPTTGYVPYNAGGSWGDSPWYRAATNIVGFYSTNQFIWQPSDSTLTIGYNAGAARLIGNNVVAIGPQSMENADSAFQSVAVGVQTLRASQSSDNVAVGHQVMANAVLANNDVGVGFNALKQVTSGYDNVAVGAEALRENLVGIENTAAGHQSLLVNTNSGLTAFGFQSLHANTSGTLNTALGYKALLNATSGGANTAVGHSSLTNLTIGVNNNALGYRSLSAVTSGSQNNAFGLNSLSSVTTSGANSGFGDSSLSRTTGDGNTGLGYNAGVTNTSGNENVFVGDSSNPQTATDSNTIVIGANAIGNGSNTATIGDTNVTSLYLGNTLIYPAGGAALWALNGDALEPSPAVGLVNITSTLADNATNTILNIDSANPFTSGGKILSVASGGNKILQAGINFNTAAKGDYSTLMTLGYLSDFNTDTNLYDAFNIGDHAGVSSTYGGTYGAGLIFNIGVYTGAFSAYTNASTLFNIGESAGGGAVLNNQSSFIYNIGEYTGVNQVLENGKEVMNIGFDSGHTQTLSDCDYVFNYGWESGRNQTFENCLSMFNYGYQAGYQAVVHGATNIFNYGAYAGNNMNLTNSAYIYTFGQNAGAGLSGSWEDVMLFGSDTLPTQSHQMVWNVEAVGSGNIYQWQNGNTNIATASAAGTFGVIHLNGFSSTPTIATNSGAGLSGASVSIAGSDLAGEITINSGLTPAVNTAICTVTFANTYSPTAPYVVISPTETNASTLGFVPFVTRTTTTFVLTNPTAQALAGSTTYKYAYVCVQ